MIRRRQTGPVTPVPPQGEMTEDGTHTYDTSRMHALNGSIPLKSREMGDASPASAGRDLDGEAAHVEEQEEQEEQVRRDAHSHYTKYALLQSGMLL